MGFITLLYGVDKLFGAAPLLGMQGEKLSDDLGRPQFLS